MAGPYTHTTLAVGEEDEAPRKPGRPPRPDITTMAVGEEDDGDGKTPVTTLAVGEEDDEAPPLKRKIPGERSQPFGGF